VSARLRNGWVFSPGLDVLAFAGPLAVSAVVVLAFAARGALDADVPPWLFAVAIVGCDVAHVWATLFRAYLDPAERRRRAAALTLVPVGVFLAGVLLHAADGATFWRALAYLAAFHFVRQQWGWMAYSARAAGEASRLDRALDQAAVYAATLFPLLWWHANLPRAFAWFVEGDFVAGTPAALGTVGLVLHVAVLGAWAVRQVFLLASGRGANLGKALVLATTWVAWVVPIVLLDSDVAFTTTNVLAHGVPYLVLVRRWGGARHRGGRGAVASLFRPGLAAGSAFYGVLLLLAFAEEAFWDRLVWRTHGGLFPLPSYEVGADALAVVVPLLAVPQATHYVLDALLWRTSPRVNPGLAAEIGLERGVAASGTPRGTVGTPLA
jgi:hypothetical protein